MNRIGLIGGGSWATAIAKILTGNSNHINWWLRNEESVNYIINFNHNPNYLSSIQFDNNFLSLSTDLIWVIENSDTIILAVPSAFLKQAL
ncbi:MAG: glycerol-3-phosphate dehydrogenase, partial [Bacteroidota bacterium]|nr:glycerol-3-phosphate dehydrogenase [Bacteroidota bacterium]